jgi:hypothetical protein
MTCGQSDDYYTRATRFQKTYAALMNRYQLGECAKDETRREPDAPIRIDNSASPRG